MLTSKEGLEHAAKAWPEGTNFVIGAVDSSLDATGYIVPGVGDIGDRLFGTGLSH
jgi:uracil phosphoribosyltransferase